MNKIAKELAKQAKKKGICEIGYNELINLDNKQKMVQMYIRGIDFCLSKEFPSNDYIRKNFKGVMESYGVFLDDNINLTNCRRCVALGSTQTKIEVLSYNVCEVYAKHTSRINVVAADHAFIEIDMFDESSVEVYAKENAKIHINHYGGTLVHHSDEGATVMIVEKHKKTY